MDKKLLEKYYKIWIAEPTPKLISILIIKALTYLIIFYLAQRHGDTEIKIENDQNYFTY